MRLRLWGRERVEEEDRADILSRTDLFEGEIIFMSR